METNLVSDWVVLAVCLGYAFIAWVVQMYRVVPPRDWLLQRILYLEAQLDPEETATGIQIGLRTDLEKIRKGIDRWFALVGVSKVQAGWRNIHGIEDDSLLNLSNHIVDEKLRTVRTQLAGISGDESKSLRSRIDKALSENANHQERAALLREANIFRHHSADSRYEDIAGLLSKAVFLTVAALAIVVALAITFDRESWFLFGAAGALVSRLSRVIRRRPSPSDYGAEWSTLLLTPALGAVAGWVGVLLVVALAEPPFNVLNGQFSDIWSDATMPIGLMMAFAFGFSERLFNRLVGSAVRQVGGVLPDGGAAHSGGRDAAGT